MAEKRICEICKQEFDATGCKITCSKECSKKLRLIRAAERSRLARERAKKKNGTERRGRVFDSTPPNTPIHNFMRELNAYNAAHPHAPLSYGKYVKMMEDKP